MIDNNQTTNIKLTLEQLQQVNIVETRLANLQAEIKIAIRNLTTLSNDTSRITKEKNYQQELLGSLNVEIENAKSKLESISTNLSKTKEDSVSLDESIAKRISFVNEKEMQLKDRESVVEKRENALTETEKTHTEKVLTHENDKKELSKKVEVLNKALSQI